MWTKLFLARNSRLLWLRMVALAPKSSTGMREYSNFSYTEANNCAVDSNFEANPKPMFEFQAEANTILEPNMVD